MTAKRSGPIPAGPPRHLREAWPRAPHQWSGADAAGPATRGGGDNRERRRGYNARTRPARSAGGAVSVTVTREGRVPSRRFASVPNFPTVCLTFEESYGVSCLGGLRGRRGLSCCLTGQEMLCAGREGGGGLHRRPGRGAEGQSLRGLRGGGG